MSVRNEKAMRDRLHYTFEAAVRSLLARPGKVARAIGRSYGALYNMRTGRSRVPVDAARALAKHMRKKARRFEEVARALERAAAVSEAGEE